MSDANESDLPAVDIDALSDEEREALNDEDLTAEGEPVGDKDPDNEDEEELDLRAPFIEWVLEHFATVEVVGTKDRAPWCDRWYDHPEVVARLFALWRARIQSRLDESLDGESNWWLSHWDRHAAVLFDPQNGPFRACTRQEGHLAERKSKTTRVITPIAPGPDWNF